MFVQVNDASGVSLAAREDFRAFELRTALEGTTLVAALHGVAELDGTGFAWVHEDWLRQQLEQDPPTPHWRADFDAMLAYAQHKGWLREAPTRSVRAHVRRA